MFAVISSPQFWKDIEQAILSKNEEILYNAVDININLNSELDSISRLSIKHLIIDITSISDLNSFVPAIRKYRILKEGAQIIIIAPNYEPGNQILAELVRMGIYDFVTPKGESLDDITILPYILGAINKPATYGKAARWDTALSSAEVILNKKSSDTPEKEKVVERVIEKVTEQETIIRTEILGTIVIAVGSTDNNIGCTHTALSISYFLSRHVNNYNIALIEMNSSDLNTLNKNCSQALNSDSFTLNTIDIYGDKTSLIDLLSFNKYNYIVIDLGRLKTDNTNCENYQEMLRANLPVIVSGSKPWQLDNLLNTLVKEDQSENTETRNWRILFNLTDQKTFNYLKEELKYEIFLSQYTPELFGNYEDNDKVLTELLQPVLPKMDKIIKNKPKLFNPLKLFRKGE